jgi:hypothetical protein
VVFEGMAIVDQQFNEEGPRRAMFRHGRRSACWSRSGSHASTQWRWRRWWRKSASIIGLRSGGMHGGGTIW